MPCQYAACFPATSLTRRASGGFRVLATARHTRVCLRAAVLQKPPRCAAAVRLTAANQAAFGIFERARRRGAAFFTRARSDGVFSRAIRGEEASPGVVALLLRCASKRRFQPCSPLARASREPKPPCIATLVHQALPHRLARQTIAYILHVLPGVERASRHVVQQVLIYTRRHGRVCGLPRRRGKRRRRWNERNAPPTR